MWGVFNISTQLSFYVFKAIFAKKAQNYAAEAFKSIYCVQKFYIKNLINYTQPASQPPPPPLPQPNLMLTLWQSHSKAIAKPSNLMKIIMLNRNSINR